MPSARPRPARRLGVAVAIGLTAAALVACADGAEPEESAVTPAETSTPVQTPPTPETTTDTEDAEAPADETTSSTEETTATTEADSREDIEEAHEIFGSLAPESLWEQFQECNSTGLEGSYECSGPEVGSFQFFDSRAKAASTTQLLTELRSSQVVEDTGRFVVGWSTLGTTAVITVVDNDEGLVMQQLISSDIEEPDDRIEELGLDNPPSDRSSRNDDSDDAESTEETTTSSAKDD